MEAFENQNPVKTESGGAALLSRPSNLIEPETPTKETAVRGMDWAHWEHDYREKFGIELTDGDKAEIRATVPAYFRLLIQIDERLKLNEKLRKD